MRLGGLLLCMATAGMSQPARAAGIVAYKAPPVPAKTLSIPAATAPTGVGANFTGTVTFQSAISTQAKDQLDGWVWQPAGATAAAPVPLVIVAHGHGGPWSNGDTSKVGLQFRRLAAALLANGVGMLLVDSFSVARNEDILTRHAGDPDPSQWAVRPNGLNDDNAFRDDAVSDHLVRPYDVVGAAKALAAVAPWANPAKLIAVGYSHGGSAVLALGLSNYPLNLAGAKTGGRRFRRLYATYPGCGLGSLGNYANSAAVAPFWLGTGTADVDTPPGPSPGQPGVGGFCTTRFTQAKAVADAAAGTLPRLFTPVWINYAGATHSWETVSTPANDAARADWIKRIVASAVRLK